MQDSKIIKSSMGIFFNNPHLTPKQEHLSYKNVDEMKVLLTKLPYAKIIWWTKSVSIYLLIINMVSKNILCTI